MGVVTSKRKCQSWGAKRIAGRLSVAQQEGDVFDLPNSINVTLWSIGYLIVNAGQRRELHLSDIHLIGPAKNLRPSEEHDAESILVSAKDFRIILKAENASLAYSWISCMKCTAMELQFSGLYELTPLVVESPEANPRKLELFEGFLDKQAQGGTEWQCRYFILVHDALLYCTSIIQAQMLKQTFFNSNKIKDMPKILSAASKSPLCRGYIRLESRNNSVNISVSSVLDEKSTFVVKYGEHRSFTLKARNTKYATTWKKKISRVANKFKDLNEGISAVKKITVNIPACPRESSFSESVVHSRMNSKDSVENATPRRSYVEMDDDFMDF